MLNIGKQEKLGIKVVHSSTTSIGPFALLLRYTLCGCLLALSLQLSALASESSLDANQQDVLETAATLASKIDPNSLPEETGPRSHGQEKSAFSFPQNFIPPGDGRPDNTRGSGARSGSCSEVSGLEPNTDAKEIRPLMPSERYGLTFQAYPTIFIDFDGDVAPVVRLRVVSETGDYDERITLPIDPDQTIQGFTLPSDRPPLETGKNYLWTLMVACDGAIHPNHPLFTGWVQRVVPTPEITEQLTSQSITDRAVWYAEQGYWYDLVATLQREITTANPGNAAVALWNQLLAFLDET